jgi:phosphatidylglycerol:prolipoprotein diacylglycerol transferase
VDPVLVQVGPFAVRWYGVMVALSILCGIWLTRRAAPSVGLPEDLPDRVALGFVVSLFVGARLAYVASHPGPYLADPLEVLRVDRGGLSSHGAILAGLAYAGWLGRREGISPWSFTDACATWIPLANALVRWGNFMNGELYGDPTSLPWGVVFPTAPEAPRHPLQLYEMATSALLFLLVHRRWLPRRQFEGEVFWKTVGALSAVRFALDFLRSEYRVVGPFALGQLAAAVLVVVSLAFLARGRTASARPG